LDDLFGGRFHVSIDSDREYAQQAKMDTVVDFSATSGAAAPVSAPWKRARNPPRRLTRAQRLNRPPKAERRRKASPSSRSPALAGGWQRENAFIDDKGPRGPLLCSGLWKIGLADFGPGGISIG
jgi:hypothetical protein